MFLLKITEGCLKLLLSLSQPTPIVAFFSFTPDTLTLARVCGIDVNVDQKDEEKATDTNIFFLIWPHLSEELLELQSSCNNTDKSTKFRSLYCPVQKHLS